MRRRGRGEKFLKAAWFTAFLLAGITGGPSVAAAKNLSDMGYTLTDLGTLGGSWSNVVAINDKGQVIGWSQTIGDLTWHAFFYSDGKITDLGTLGGSSSYPSGINDKGQVVGWSQTAGDSAVHAFLYSNGTMTDLGTLGGSNSQPVGINDIGQVVGSSYTVGGDIHTFLYSNGAMTDLGTLGGSSSFAFGHQRHRAGGWLVPNRRGPVRPRLPLQQRDDDRPGDLGGIEQPSLRHQRQRAGRR